MLVTNMTFASWKKQGKGNIFNIVFVCILFYINPATSTNFSLKHMFCFISKGFPPNLNPCIFLLIYFIVFFKGFSSTYCIYKFLFATSSSPAITTQEDFLWYKSSQCHQILLYQGLLMYHYYTPLLPNHSSEYKNKVFFICARYLFNRT